MLNGVVGWIVIAILAAYTVYSCYSSFTVYAVHTKALKDFKSKHQNIRLFDCSKGWVISSIIMIVVCILIAISGMGMEPDQLTTYRFAYVCIAVIFFSIIFSSLSGKRMWFTDDGFFFDDRYFKFRDIAKKTPIGGVGSKNLHLVMKDNYEITINAKMNDKIDQEIKLWKQKKKLKAHK